MLRLKNIATVQNELSSQTQVNQRTTESLRNVQLQLKEKEAELSAKNEEIERIRQDSRVFSDRFASWTTDLTRLAEGRDRKIGKMALKIQKSMKAIATNATRLADASASRVSFDGKMVHDTSLTVAALEEEITEWKERCKDLKLRLERATATAKEKEKRLERRASVKLIAAESGRKKAEDMLRAQVEGEKERIKQQLTPKIKAVKRSAEVALKELRDKTASMENELRDVRQELAFVRAEKDDVLMEVRF